MSADVVEDMPEADYHAHPALSQSLAKLLLPPSTPAHFQWRRDNPQLPRDVFDFGHAAHELVLGKGAGIVVIDAKDWRTKAAQEKRDAARAEGKAPMLTADFDRVQAMAAAIHAHPTALALLQGQTEQSVFWQHDNIPLRCRMDSVPNLGTPIIVDYKTTTDASPTGFAKSVIDYGYDLQAAWYLAAANEIGLEGADFVFIAQEKEPPHLVGVYVLDDEALDRGRDLMRRALDTYRDCTDTGQWPGYPTDIQTLTLPNRALKESA